MGQEFVYVGNLGSLVPKKSRNQLPPSDAARKQEKKLEDRFRSVLSFFKKCYPSRNVKFNNLGIFQSLKLRNLWRKSFEFLLS